MSEHEMMKVNKPSLKVVSMLCVHRIKAREIKLTNDKCKRDQTLILLLTNKKTMSIWLFQNPTDSRDVFNGKPKHDQIHRCLTHHVVVFQTQLNSLE